MRTSLLTEAQVIRMLKQERRSSSCAMVVSRRCRGFSIWLSTDGSVPIGDSTNGPRNLRKQ